MATMNGNIQFINLSRPVESDPDVVNKNMNPISKIHNVTSRRFQKRSVRKIVYVFFF